MKTLEMLNTIKPGQKMERIKSKYSYTYGYVSFIDDVLCWDNSRSNPFQIAYDHLEDDEWQLVQEPVTWQEAIEEWKKDKDIYVIVGETRYEQSGHECLGIFTYINSEGRKEKQYGFFILMFTDGKWYIDNNK